MAVTLTSPPTSYPHLSVFPPFNISFIQMHINELKALHVSEVLLQAEALEIENTGRMRKQELMFAIIK
ncbi:MAG: hypothetical protein RLY95_796, partial [Pseudomonadota bacterium]